MTVVIDCNILVMCLTSRSPYHSIYRKLVSGDFHLAITTDIALEYEEIIQQKYGTATANAFVAILNELPNVHFITTHYKWQLIEDDADDNKYSDCAVAGQAEWLVTQDSHFNILKKISFPQINVIAIDEFANLLANLEN
jgi:putative PIN family toxin of toxin-antitoxin system